MSDKPTYPILQTYGRCDVCGCIVDAHTGADLKRCRESALSARCCRNGCPNEREPGKRFCSHGCETEFFGADRPKTASPLPTDLCEHGWNFQGECPYCERDALRAALTTLCCEFAISNRMERGTGRQAYNLAWKLATGEDAHR